MCSKLALRATLPPRHSFGRDIFQNATSEVAWVYDAALAMYASGEVTSCPLVELGSADVGEEEDFWSYLWKGGAIVFGEKASCLLDIS